MLRTELLPTLFVSIRKKKELNDCKYQMCIVEAAAIQYVKRGILIVTLMFK